MERGGKALTGWRNDGQLKGEARQESRRRRQSVRREAKGRDGAGGCERK